MGWEWWGCNSGGEGGWVAGCGSSAADTRIFRVPRMGRRTPVERSFQHFGPVLWNSLPLSVRHSSSLSSLKSKLKTHLFSSSY